MERLYKGSRKRIFNFYQMFIIYFILDPRLREEVRYLVYIGILILMITAH